MHLAMASFPRARQPRSLPPTNRPSAADRLTSFTASPIKNRTHNVEISRRAGTWLVQGGNVLRRQLSVRRATSLGGRRSTWVSEHTGSRTFCTESRIRKF